MSKNERRNGTETFEYAYSAPNEEERREIASIRRQYEAREVAPEGKLERLRRLDARVRNTANAVSLALGVIGLLIFGLGLTMVLEWTMLIWGIVVAAVGSAPIALAYPVYKITLRRNKEKYGEEILRLSEELLNEK